jgi:hypothetical protein
MPPSPIPHRLKNWRRVAQSSGLEAAGVTSGMSLADRHAAPKNLVRVLGIVKSVIGLLEFPDARLQMPDFTISYPPL